MKNKLEKQKHELEEKLTLLENNSYPELLGRVMLNDTLIILEDYCGRDFEKQMNRYLVLEMKYKPCNIKWKEDCLGL